MLFYSNNAHKIDIYVTMLLCYYLPGKQDQVKLLYHYAIV